MASLAELLVCPACHGSLAWSSCEGRCLHCSSRFPMVEGIPLFASAAAGGEFKRRQAEFFERDFRPVSTSRYAIYYRHKPGWVMCLLSRSVHLPLAKAAIGIANQFAGRFGNKLTVQAVGKTEEAA